MKDATVSARVEYDVKSEAEEILQKLGVPVSTVSRQERNPVGRLKIREPKPPVRKVGRE